jgi:uncharacterized protein (TIRG00374 family)
MGLSRYWLLALLALLLGLAVPLSYGGLDALRFLLEVPGWLVPAMIAMVLAGWGLNALRLYTLADGLGVGIGYRQALQTVVATEFASCASPAGTGGPVAFVLLLRRHGLVGARAAAFFAVEQVMDLLFFLGALPIAVILLASRTDLPELGGIATLLGLVLGTGILTVWSLLDHYRKLLLLSGRLLQRLRVPSTTRSRLARWALQFRSGVSLLLRLPKPRLLAVYGLCAGHWLLRYSILYLVLEALGHPLAWPYLLLVQMISLSVGQLSFLPGGSGGVELGISSLLAPFVPGTTLAGALILWRFGTFYWYLLAGTPVFLLTMGGGMFVRIARVLRER